MKMFDHEKDELDSSYGLTEEAIMLSRSKEGWELVAVTVSQVGKTFYWKRERGHML